MIAARCGMSRKGHVRKLAAKGLLKKKEQNKQKPAQKKESEKTQILLRKKPNHPT